MDICKSVCCVAVLCCVSVASSQQKCFFFVSLDFCRFYTLGLMLEHGHKQIQPYGSKQPSYAHMKKRVIAHMTGSGADSVIHLNF
jgi:hypothetical protein